MTQAIGLASALTLLAFVLILYALLSVAIRRFVEGDSEAARGPLVLCGVLVIAGLISVFTWAAPAVGNAASSVSWAIGSVVGWVAAFPLSLICLGPLLFMLIFTLATPAARRFIGNNYLPASVLVLVTFFLALVIYLVLQVFGGWGVLALLVLVGAIIGLGSRGLVFVPELNDGPRLGEGATSSLLRVSGKRARRSIYLVGNFFANLPTRVMSRQGAPVMGLVVVLAFAGWWVSGRTEAESERPVAIVVLSTPTTGVAEPIRTSPTATVTPTPGVSLLRVANTGGEGVLMREQPGRTGKPMATLPEGTTLDIAGPEQNADGMTWRQVREKGGKTGWVSTQYLVVEEVYGLVRVANTGGEGVILRAKAGKSGKTVLVLKEGTELKLIGEDAKADGLTWKNVKDDKGNVGYVSAQFVVQVP